ILAAFGLLNLAFGTFARAYEPELASRLTSITSDAVGPGGLIGGQAIDLLATDQQISFETLERIHRGKTGALFVAAATCGALTAGAAAEPIAAFTAFAKSLGLAFRLVDELRQQLRALGYLDAGVNRFLLAPARERRRPLAVALGAGARVGLLAGALLGPAAAIGVGARIPGLVSGVRDAAVLALYLAVLFS